MFTFIYLEFLSLFFAAMQIRCIMLEYIFPIADQHPTKLESDSIAAKGETKRKVVYKQNV